MDLASRQAAGLMVRDSERIRRRFPLLDRGTEVANRSALSRDTSAPASVASQQESPSHATRKQRTI